MNTLMKLGSCDMQLSSWKASEEGLYFLSLLGYKVKWQFRGEVWRKNAHYLSVNAYYLSVIAACYITGFELGNFSSLFQET